MTAFSAAPTVPLALAGRAILVAEDEYYAAMEMRRELSHAGATVVGPAPSLAKTLALVEASAHLDGAVLDINLGGEMVFPAADRLRARGVRFVFATGYDRAMIPPRFADVPRFEKPLGAPVLRRLMADLTPGA